MHYWSRSMERDLLSDPIIPETSVNLFLILSTSKYSVEFIEDEMNVTLSSVFFMSLPN